MCATMPVSLQYANQTKESKEFHFLIARLGTCIVQPQYAYSRSLLNAIASVAPNLIPRTLEPKFFNI